MDLERLKQGFSSLVQHAEQDVLPAFIVWIDLKVAEFKVNGYIVFDSVQDTNNSWLHYLQRAAIYYQQYSYGNRQTAASFELPQATSPYPTIPRHTSTPTARAQGEAAIGQWVQTDTPRAASHVKSEPADTGYEKFQYGNSSERFNEEQSLDVAQDLSVNRASSRDAVERDQAISSDCLPTHLPEQGISLRFCDSQPETPASAQSSDMNYHHSRQPFVSMPASNVPVISNVHHSENPNRSSIQAHIGGPADYDSIHNHIVNAQFENVADARGGHNRKDTLNDIIQSIASRRIVNSMSEVESSNHNPPLMSTSQNTSLMSTNQLPGTTSMSESREGSTAVTCNGTERPDIPIQAPLPIRPIANHPPLPTSPKDLQPQMVVVNGQQYCSCPTCHKMFRYTSSFSRHMKLHRGIFSHICGICGRKFTRKEHFDRHKCSRRPNKPQRVCSLDGETLANAQNIAYPPEIPVNALGTSEMVPEFQGRRKHNPEVEGIEFGNVDSREDRRNTPEENGYLPVDQAEKNGHGENRYGMHHFEHSRWPLGLENHRFSSVQVGESQSCPPQLEHDPNSTHVSPGSLHLEHSADGATELQPEAASSNHAEESSADLRDLQNSYEDPPGPADAESDKSPTRQVSQNSTILLDTGQYEVTRPQAEQGQASDGTSDVIHIVKQSNYLKLRQNTRIIQGLLCYECPHCHKVFARNSNFSRHMRIHRGVYNYICSTCNRGFFRKEHWEKHKCSHRGMPTRIMKHRKTKADNLLSTDAPEPDTEPSEEQNSSFQDPAEN